MLTSNSGQAPSFSVSDFVAVFNLTLEAAYPQVIITGELANFRVSKNRWLYFDLKDEFASVKFFGTVYNLPGPLEDGLMIQVSGLPKLHPQFGFSVNVQSIQAVGEGSLLRAAALLEAKLKAEGLFEPDRKRRLPYPPARLGLITSAESAAHTDFLKIIKRRWGGLAIELADVQVQGEVSPAQIVAAINYFNQQANPVEVLVLTRGGGSAEDLAAFNSEPVTRAIAASRIPTLVAIGHEKDISLAELAADQRASTPSNAAELLVPDKSHEQARLKVVSQTLVQSLTNLVATGNSNVRQQLLQLNQIIVQYLHNQRLFLGSKTELLGALSPSATLKRGYAIVRDNESGIVVKSIGQLKLNQPLNLQFEDGQADTSVTRINKKRS